MDKTKKTQLFSKLALLAAAIIWGSTFIVVKSTVDIFPTHYLLGIRFTIGFVILAVIFRKKLKMIDKRYLINGAMVGAAIFLAYSLQTIGITTTSPGKNAFLTAIYCVLVPFFFWIANKTKPDKYNFIAAVVCIAGIGFVSLTENFTISAGDAFTLAGGVMYAVHIVLVAKFTKGQDPILITILQFGYAAIISWIVGFVSEDFPFGLITMESMMGVVFLAVFGTTIALLLQNIGLKNCPPASASILMSLEAVFGVLFSVLLYREELTAKLILGFALIFVAVLVSETKLSFLKSKKSLSPKPQDIDKL